MSEQKKDDAEQAALPETLDDWLRGNDADPKRVKSRPDGSVEVTILHPYKPEPGEDPGPKAVKFRPMYCKDFREIYDFRGHAQLHEVVVKLADIAPDDLERMHFADYDVLTTVAMGMLQKKFLPTS